MSVVRLLVYFISFAALVCISLLVHQRRLTRKTREFWKGKAVLLTGASSGIGVELAKQLSALGSNVVVTARRISLLEETAKECNGMSLPRCYRYSTLSSPPLSAEIIKRHEHRTSVIPVQADQRSDEDCRRAVSCCLTAFGRVDVLILNAAYGSSLCFSLSESH